MLLNKILAAYDWYDLPEGPKFVETHRDAFRTSGHWLFFPGIFSTFHKVHNSEELWLIHSGKLLLHILEPDGRHRLLPLGSDFEAGERPVWSVPQGCWQAAEIPGGVPYAFGTNVCAPAFSFEALETARREDLIREFPKHEELILRLTKD